MKVTSYRSALIIHLRAARLQLELSRLSSSPVCRGLRGGLVGRAAHKRCSG